LVGEVKGKDHQGKGHKGKHKTSQSKRATHYNVVKVED